MLSPHFFAKSNSIAWVCVKQSILAWWNHGKGHEEELKSIINKVKESAPGTGFNAATEEYVDMVKVGILDPAKVTRSALQNATSVAATLLTTESVVANIKEDIPAPAPGGMGMM